MEFLPVATCFTCFVCCMDTCYPNCIFVHIASREWICRKREYFGVESSIHAESIGEGDFRHVTEQDQRFVKTFTEKDNWMCVHLKGMRPSSVSLTQIVCHSRPSESSLSRSTQQHGTPSR